MRHVVDFLFTVLCIGTALWVLWAVAMLVMAAWELI